MKKNRSSKDLREIEIILLMKMFSSILKGVSMACGVGGKVKKGAKAKMAKAVKGKGKKK